MNTGLAFSEVEAAMVINMLIDASSNHPLILNAVIGAGLVEGGCDGALKFDPQRWSPLDTYQAVVERIRHRLGERALYDIRLATTDHAITPTIPEDLHEALRFIDIGYHMNHSWNGQLM